MPKNISKESFNPFTYGKKLVELYESDKLLGTVSLPWGVVFMIWFFSRDPAVIQVLMWLSLTVGAVAIASAIKHVIGGFFVENFKIKAQDMNTLETQTKIQKDKEIAESHYQMKTLNRMAKTTNSTAMILLNRTLDYLKTENPKGEILELYAKTIRDLNKELGKDSERSLLPFKDFIKDIYADFADTDYIPGTIDNIPHADVTVEEINDLANEIHSSNPNTNDLKDISHES